MPDVPSPEQFRRSRATGNEQLMAHAPVVESFFALDGAAYATGALPVATKELLGLVLSVAKDCEECVYYHLERCEQEDLHPSNALLLATLGLTPCGVGDAVAARREGRPRRGTGYR